MQNVFKDLDSKINDLEASKHGKLKIYTVLLIFFVLFHLPNVLVIKYFSSAVSPLYWIYIGKNLFLPGGMLNPDLATTVISPSVVLLDFPPGIYLLSYLLGSVKNIFLFSFIVQSILPILYYKLFRSISSPFVSLSLSIFSSFYFINTYWWSPDFLIQPLIMIGLLILLDHTDKFKINEWHKPLYLGLITGIVIILKHNEGIFWGILVVSFLMVSSIIFSGNGQYATKNRNLLLALFVGFFAYGFVFLSKQIYLDAAIYYLLPYFTFWGINTYNIVKNKSIGFNAIAFLKNSISFSVAALIFPIIIFIWVGSAVGYARYFSSFGMGLEYIPIWDFGIAGIMGRQANFHYTLTVQNIYLNYQSIIIMILFLLPFSVNCLVNINLYHNIRSKIALYPKKYFEISLLGIMAVFMFYPLEGYHILSTKLFIFLFVLLYLFKYNSIFKYDLMKYSKLLKFILILMMIPVVMYSVYHPLLVSKTSTSYGYEQIEKIIALPMEEKLSEELSKQVAVVKNAINGSSYYVIDSTGQSLATLMAIEDNHYPQYYLEMRKGIMNQEVTNAIISSIQEVSYVMVNSNDYQKYLSGQQDDPFMAQILKFVNENYVIVDQYEVPKEKSPSTEQIQSFLIMKKSTS
ncbi:MAG: hypothetical protein WC556_01930 [Candidatus Methanoperedens sp.]